MNVESNINVDIPMAQKIRFQYFLELLRERDGTTWSMKRYLTEHLKGLHFSPDEERELAKRLAAANGVPTTGNGRAANGLAHHRKRKFSPAAI